MVSEREGVGRPSLSVGCASSVKTSQAEMAAEALGITRSCACEMRRSLLREVYETWTPSRMMPENLGWKSRTVSHAAQRPSH